VHRGRLLTLRDDAVAFRHDLARRALEDAIAPIRRRELDRLVLDALDRAETPIPRASPTTPGAPATWPRSAA
jgi:hypothetical protein